MKCYFISLFLVFNHYAFSGSIHKAVETCNLSKVKKMFSNLQDEPIESLLEQRRYDGKTPIFLAVSNNCYKVADYLIQKKVNLNVTDNKGFSPLCYAAYKGGSLFKPTVKVYDEVAFLLVTKGADVNVFCKYGMTPLATALFDNKLALASLIWSKNPIIDQPDAKFKMLPIHVATRQGYCNFLKAMAKSNPALLKVQDSWGWTSFHYANWRGHKCAIDIHFQLKAPVLKDREGRTPFQVLEYNAQAIKNFLLEYNIHQTDLL